MRAAAAAHGLEKLAPVAAWASLFFVVFCTLSPLQLRPALPAPVSFEHIVAFALVGLLFGLAYPRHLVFVCILVLGSAMLLEISQLITPDRHARLHDAVEKVAGGTIGITAAWVILYLKQAARLLRG